ncbi:MAG TPA: ferritin-like protein [Phenylobacterium sp.]|jgi:hypothetical protein|nr:ferritin-like protein [Phenylobacterium sp.]
MILLQRALVAELTGPAVDVRKVRDSLQQAIALEHATIPPYLYALYSLAPGRNVEIAQIIQSVVLEEMLHMTLSSNVLNALGGTPRLDAPDFIPTYPGPLPGGVESDLMVHLAPFSMPQLQTFLKIEEPEHPLNFKAGLTAEETITIGQFYTAISDAIARLGNAAFVHPPRNQVGPDVMPNAIVVTDVATAQQAIKTIIDQGEGTSTSPDAGVGGGYAHYYRFMQIQKQRLLVATPGGVQPELDYAYQGAAVPFDPTGVYAAPTDPGAAPGYPAGSAQAFANDNFNYAYTCLLKALQALFSRDPGQQQFDRTLGLMMSLKGQAKAMMSGSPNPAVITGPSFQYQPTNPS